MRSALHLWRFAVAAVLAAAAIALAVESHSLATARAANERDATRGLLVVSGAKPRGVQEKIGEREQALLGLDGMPALRRALDELAAKRTAKGHAAAERATKRAERTLEDIFRSDAPASTRAQAANLLGILVVQEAVTHPGAGGLERAIRLFRRSIQLAPESEPAKYNLELLLMLPGSSRQSKSARTTGPGAGAGSDGAGTGY